MWTEDLSCAELCPVIAINNISDTKEWYLPNAIAYLLKLINYFTAPVL